MRDVPEKYKAGQAYHDSLYISIGEVEDRFKVSKQQQRNLYLKEEAPDAIYIGATLFYWRATAEPFFRDYDKRQKDRIANSEERKDKRRPGRPKKEKSVEGWSYELMGKVYTDTRKPAEVHAEWLIRLAQDFPQFYQIPDRAIILPDVMINKDRYPQYYEVVLPIRIAINEAFKQFKG